MSAKGSSSCWCPNNSWGDMSTQVCEACGANATAPARSVSADACQCAKGFYGLLQLLFFVLVLFVVWIASIFGTRRPPARSCSVIEAADVPSVSAGDGKTCRSCSAANSTSDVGSARVDMECTCVANFYRRIVNGTSANASAMECLPCPPASHSPPASVSCACASSSSRESADPLE